MHNPSSSSQKKGEGQKQRVAKKMPLAAKNNVPNSENAARGHGAQTQSPMPDRSAVENEATEKNSVPTGVVQTNPVQVGNTAPETKGNTLAMASAAPTKQPSSHVYHTQTEGSTKSSAHPSIARAKKTSALHPFLQILANDNHLSQERAKNTQKRLQERGSILNENALLALKNILTNQNKWISHEVFQRTQASLLALPFDAHVDKNLPITELAQSIPMQYAKRYVLFPLKKEGDVVDIVVENAWDWHVIEDVARHLGGRPNVVISTRTSIFHLINRAYDLNENTAEQVIESLDDNLAAEGFDWALDEPEDLLEAQDEEPIKRLLNSLLHQAVKSRVSDVHIEASNTELVVRYRVDGTLQVVGAFPKAIHRSLLNRIKIMSKLDISQHGLPQDGRTLVIIASKKVDIRVSTMPTVYGEKAVLRILPQEQAQFDLTMLGMPAEIRMQIEKLLQAPSGMFLVTGPTGSGKTTTLYAALNTLNRESSNIMTIEDPVEYRIAGYVQTEVNVKTGLTFANALRSVLRQDPDVIMVGEMRDQETALIAIQASLTGHFVFSTLHTNSAAATLTRLVDMGIEPYLASSTVRGVLAQRLVRRLCTHCKKPTQSTMSQEALRQLHADFSNSFHASGCGYCIGGVSGRVGVFEMLHVTRGVQEALKTTTEAHAIADAAIADGMIPMRTWVLDMVQKGTITAEEALRLVNDEANDKDA